MSKHAKTIPWRQDVERVVAKDWKTKVSIRGYWWQFYGWVGQDCQCTRLRQMVSRERVGHDRRWGGWKRLEDLLGDFRSYCGGARKSVGGCQPQNITRRAKFGNSIILPVSITSDILWETSCCFWILFLKVPDSVNLIPQGWELKFQATDFLKKPNWDSVIHYISRETRGGDTQTISRLNTRVAPPTFLMNGILWCSTKPIDCKREEISWFSIC